MPPVHAVGVNDTLGANVPYLVARIHYMNAHLLTVQIFVLCICIFWNRCEEMFVNVLRMLSSIVAYLCYGIFMKTCHDPKYYRLAGQICGSWIKLKMTNVSPFQMWTWNLVYEFVLRWYRSHSCNTYLAKPFVAFDLIVFRWFRFVLVFRAFLCAIRDIDWNCTCLLYHELKCDLCCVWLCKSYCPLIKITFLDFSLSSFVFTWSVVYTLLMGQCWLSSSDFGHVWPTFVIIILHFLTLLKINFLSFCLLSFDLLYLLEICYV